MKKVNTLKKIITLMTILALLFMILPMSVMAKGNGKGAPAAASEKVKPNADKVKPDKAEAQKSARAQLVAARNEWAKTVGLVPPGQANLIYKYIVSAVDYVAVPIMDKDDFNAFVNLFISKEGDDIIDVPTLMGAIKQIKLENDEFGDDDDDDDDDEGEAEDKPETVAS